MQYLIENNSTFYSFLLKALLYIYTDNCYHYYINFNLF